VVDKWWISGEISFLSPIRKKLPESDSITKHRKKSVPELDLSKTKKLSPSYPPLIHQNSIREKAFILCVFWH
jgi:hypothetical protein